MARQFHSEITFPVHAQIEAADLEAFRTGRVAAHDGHEFTVIHM